MKANDPEQQANPWRCEKCGSLNVQQRVWVDPNSGEVLDWHNVEDDNCWCADCEAHTDQIEHVELMGTIEKWWNEKTTEEKIRIWRGIKN